MLWLKRTWALVIVLMALGATSAQAIDVPQDPPAIAQRLMPPMLRAEPSIAAVEPGHPPYASRAGFERFLATYGGSWEVRWDERADRPNLVQGSGMPMLPDAPVDLKDVERSVRGFIGRFPELFRVDPADLRLDLTASGPAGEHMWFVELQQTFRGVVVEGAKVFFRLNHGRLIQFGTERVADVRIDRVPRIAKFAALGRVLAQVGVGAGRVTVLDQGTLEIVPLLPRGETSGERYVGVPGKGYDHRLVWQVSFRVAGDPATYRARLDAQSGELLELVDRNLYANATVSGGIYPVTNSDPEILQPFPQTSVSNNGTKITNGFGVYDYSGGTATTTLNGRYTRMSDNCAATGGVLQPLLDLLSSLGLSLGGATGISLSSSTDGNLNLGTSGGTDCTTPGIGGAGNTHAARTAFYHLTQSNRRAAVFLPSNTWLQGTLRANVNINQTCNAFWNGSTVNFYRSGGGCSNSGEIASIMRHEWGHGLDQNTGGAANERGTGEAVGDIFAMLESQDGCIGQNFRPGLNCPNCQSCTGVRDISDFDISGPAVIARPSTVTDDAGIDCDRLACPFLASGLIPYQGPMGYEGHCESYIASSAVWDLGQLLVGAHGTELGFSKLEEIWYESLAPTKSAYQLVSGGRCNASAVVNGCGATNWYTVFLAVDDDDGNLANGTPDGCRIWDAFDAHGIACGTRPVCSGDAPPPIVVSGPAP
ncbi:MAG: hypothetical protein ACRETN_09150 [Nevskiales bacterium]